MLFALVALTAMLLATGLLVAFRRRLTALLEEWAREPLRPRVGATFTERPAR